MFWILNGAYPDGRPGSVKSPARWTGANVLSKTSIRDPANFAGSRIDVFDNTFAPVHLAGDFTDPGLPSGYAPFNIQNIGGELYVTYAKVNPAEPDEELAGEGFGFVSAFGTDGTFHGDLLVGNFGDGRIHAFKWSAEDGWEEHGVLKGTDHTPIEIDGLWGIGFGNGATSGPTNTLFFAAGPDDETHGLFGSITAPVNP